MRRPQQKVHCFFVFPSKLVVTLEVLAFFLYFFSSLLFMLLLLPSRVQLLLNLFKMVVTTRFSFTNGSYGVQQEGV
jgi:hypothetical protein